MQRVPAPARPTSVHHAWTDSIGGLFGSLGAALPGAVGSGGGLERICPAEGASLVKGVWLGDAVGAAIAPGEGATAWSISVDDGAGPQAHATSRASSHTRLTSGQRGWSQTVSRLDSRTARQFGGAPKADEGVRGVYWPGLPNLSKNAVWLRPLAAIALLQASAAAVPPSPVFFAMRYLSKQSLTMTAS